MSFRDEIYLKHTYIIQNPPYMLLQAGKNRERLLIVPEPVAALAYWLHFADIRKLNVHNDFNPFNKTKKLVVDIGGKINA